VDGDKVCITAAGTYVLSGNLTDGQVLVNCVDAGVVDLVLKDVTITNNDSACIFIEKAQNAVITLYEGTVNTLADGYIYLYPNALVDEPDGAIFSLEDLTINGSGKLIVTGNYLNGIVSKDGLTIDGGDIQVNAQQHAIKGKDYLVINDGNILINALGDGIKTTNIENELVGYLEINGGSLDIYSEDEAIQASVAARFNGGLVNIRTLNNGIRCARVVEFNGGEVHIDAADVAIDTPTVLVEKCTVTINGVPYVPPTPVAE
jgi:hypothetical protein